MRIFFFLSIFFFPFLSAAQNQLRLKVKNSEGEILPGTTASIPTLKMTAVADSSGTIFFPNLPSGRITIVLTHSGYHARRLGIDAGTATGETEITLEPEAHEEEEVIVMATRSSRTIHDIPTRVEIISGEELEEKANMKPGDIRMLLNESTGIQTQQTSATSMNASIRIQGLDGRYTQVLRDGYPVYGGFSSGLSLLQVAPLDLKQVEVIKGSVSTLYGGGAIAGLVNLVSKTPGEEPERLLMANVTSAGGADLSGFYSRRSERTGISFFASRNSSERFDPANTGVSAIPEFTRYTVNPRFFLYGNRLTVDLGLNLVTENRSGGTWEKGSPEKWLYLETNKSRRGTGQLGITRNIDSNTHLNFRSSYSLFDRRITIPGYVFAGIQRNLFSEINLVHQGEKMQWIGGVNFIKDEFEEKEPAGLARNSNLNIPGVFIQNTAVLSSKFSIETGLRLDHADKGGWMLLPRASFMYRASEKLTMRLGGGSGYKAPTYFTEESERLLFRDIQPLQFGSLQNERSAGGNFDINYRVNAGRVGISINQLIFYTRINDPLLLEPITTGYRFRNAQGYYSSAGTETNLRITYGIMKIFLGYTYTDATMHIGESSWLPLTARHRLNNVLMLERENNYRLGFEAYYFGPQKLFDGSRSNAYWILGLMGEKQLMKNLSAFLNFENFGDTRQSRFGSLYSGPATQPLFNEIYAPLDGFVMNGGLKWRF